MLAFRPYHAPINMVPRPDRSLRPIVIKGYGFSLVRAYHTTGTTPHSARDLLNTPTFFDTGTCDLHCFMVHGQ